MPAGNGDSYPVSLMGELDPNLSRWLWLVKWWLFVIPHYLVLALLQGGSTPRFSGVNAVLVVKATIGLLFTGRYSQDIFRLVVGINRWSVWLPPAPRW